MDDADNTLHIITRAKTLESMLRRAGGIGKGLRELSESMGDELNEEELKLCRYIGAIRNQAAHEIPEENSAPVDMEVFNQSCDMLENKLRQLQGEPPIDPVAQLQRRMELFFRNSGYIPVLHIIFPLRLFYAAMRPGAGLATALLFGIFAIMPLPLAIEEGRKYIFYISGLLYLCSYAYGIWHALRQTPTTAPKALAGIPAVNLLYLLWSLIDVVKWNIFPGALLLLLLDLLPYLLIGKIGWGWITGIFIASYAATAVTTKRWNIIIEPEKDKL